MSNPLNGWRVVLTRAAGRSDELADRLRALGAEPIVFPTISHGPPPDPEGFNAALDRLAGGGYDWLVLTSVTAVQALAGRLDPRAVPALRVAAIGPATAGACRNLLGRTPALVPDSFIAEELAAALGDLHGRRVLLPNADIARPVLESQLTTAGAQVERVVAYTTITNPDPPFDMAAMLARGEIDAITFSSGSTARAFLEMVGPRARPDVERSVIACIGPATARVCHELGLEPDVVADLYTGAGLVQALAAYAAGHQLSSHSGETP
jgi:uroporphyrinogen-III synthase